MDRGEAVWSGCFSSSSSIKGSVSAERRGLLEAMVASVSVRFECRSGEGA